MGGCADAASNATTIIIYSLGGSIQDSVLCGDADRTLFFMYAPFSHFYAARLVNCRSFLSHASAPACSVPLARTPHWQGGHVALLAWSEFRGRPPTRRGADVRYALTIILCFYCEITSVICLYFITLPMDCIASLTGSAASRVVYWTCLCESRSEYYCETGRPCSFMCWMVIKSNLLCFYGVEGRCVSIVYWKTKRWIVVVVWNRPVQRKVSALSVVPRWRLVAPRAAGCGPRAARRPVTRGRRPARRAVMRHADRRPLHRLTKRSTVYQLEGSKLSLNLVLFLPILKCAVRTGKLDNLVKPHFETRVNKHTMKNWHFLKDFRFRIIYAKYKYITLTYKKKYKNLLVVIWL